jgi:hypothetical protein
MDCRRLVTLAIYALAVLLAPSFARAEYSPSLGRFLQRDPNAMGQPVMDDPSWFHGRAPVHLPLSVDIGRHYQDGMNTYQYVKSNPLTNSDPLGLFVMSPLDTLAVGMEVKSLVKDMFEQYSFFQEYDLEWALDWSVSDDGSTHSPMLRRFGAGTDEAVVQDDGPAMAGVTGLLRTVKGLARAYKIGRPAMAAIDTAIQKVQRILRVDTSRAGFAKSGGPRYRSADGMKEWRLDPPGKHHERWHINYIDRTLPGKQRWGRIDIE